MNDIALPRIKRSREKRQTLPNWSSRKARVQSEKIHYIGYNDDNDEWRESSEIVPLSIPVNNSSDTTVNTSTIPVPPTMQPYNPYIELGIRTKQSLTCGRKDSPSVKITMGFDYFLFMDGLQPADITTKTVQGLVHYKIRSILI